MILLASLHKIAPRFHGRLRGMISQNHMLLEFYGEECPHCVRMKPLVEKLEKELGVMLEKYEVWHSDANAKKMDEYDTGLCGGVPFFFNTESKKFICGSEDYEKLKEWAISK